MVEAIAAGAVPLLPDRLSYPELLPEAFHAAVLYRDGELIERLRIVLTDPAAARARVAGLRETMGRFDWSEMVARYDAAAATTVDTRC